MNPGAERGIWGPMEPKVPLRIALAEFLCASCGSLRRMHGTGKYSISDLAELFSISRPTVYRTLARAVT
jgi:hypothetical protein